MARIVIEDLAPFEELTPEEKNAISGAGRAAFMPMFGPAESEAFMQVAVAYAVSPPLLFATRDAARERELFPGRAGPVDRMFRALATHDRPDLASGVWSDMKPRKSVPPPRPAPAAPVACDREAALPVADAVLERLRRDVLTQQSLFQIRSATPRGVTAWDLDERGGVRGFSVTVHLEFDDALPGFDARPGDLVVALRYAGREGTNDAFRIKDCQFTVGGARSDAHAGLELCVRMRFAGQTISRESLAQRSETVVAEASGPLDGDQAKPTNDGSLLPLHQASTEAQAVAYAVASQFATEVIQRGMNRWMLQDVLDAHVAHRGDEIMVVLQVDYGISGAAPEKHKQARVELTFALGDWSGNDQLYQFKKLVFSGHDGSFAGQLEERVREVFAAGVGIPRYDPKQVADNACAALRFVLGGDCFLRELEPVDRGLRVEVSVGSDCYEAEGWQGLLLRLELQRAEQAGRTGPERWVFLCDDIRATASDGERWFDVEGTSRFREALRGVILSAGRLQLPGRVARSSDVALEAFFAADPAEDVRV